MDAIRCSTPCLGRNTRPAHFRSAIDWRLAQLALLLWVLWPLTASAEHSGFSIQRPGEHRLPEPAWANPLPTWPARPIEATAAEQLLSGREQLTVRRFTFTGNTVFTDQQLATVTTPYTGRTLSAEELQEVRRQLTLYYVERGYLTSGALIPDQTAADDVVQIQIVEGQLADVEISGQHHLQAAWLQERLRPEQQAPLNIQQLQERLQRLQQHPLIEQLQAELAPGLRPGESVLHLAVREASPYEIGLAVANNNPPSVGTTRAYLYGLDRNLSGVGDSLWLSYGHSLESHTDDWRVAYTRPLNAGDTTVQLWAERNETSVIEERFDRLDISSRLQTYGLALSHPFYRTPQQTLTLGLNLERRHSEAYLLGIPFSFGPGEENGEATVTVARLTQDWLDRRQNQVIAARSSLSFGLDAADATVHGHEPDGRFLSWLGQFQWARRFADDEQLIFKTSLQWANDTLLAMEKCTLGGMNTVRGYSENTLVRDRCFTTSLEFRWPLTETSRNSATGQAHLAVFADYGDARNKAAFDLKPNRLYSAGLGILWNLDANTHAAIYWGYPFRDASVGDQGWLSSRIHFSIQAAY